MTRLRDEPGKLSRDASASAPASATAPQIDRAFISAWLNVVSGIHSASPAAPMPGADDLMMRIYAAMAQKEGELITERTKAALAAAKARGRMLGGGIGAGDRQSRPAPVPLP